MSLEEKMFMRFQKEKMKKAKNSSIYNLDDAPDAHVLTHKGSILGASNMEDDEWVSSGDEDDRLGKEVVNNLHFGGGFVPKDGGKANAESNRDRTKAEILQEIIMKSKLHKMQRKEAKDAQEDQREEIDKQFEELIAASAVELNPVGKYNARADKTSSNKQKDDFDDYDEMFNAMQYETKALPSDRTKTAEELALEARERLEKLEEARLKRMNSEVDAEEDEVVSSALRIAPVGKKRKINDDEEVAEFGDNYGWNSNDVDQEEDDDGGEESDESGADDFEEDEEDEGEDEEEDDNEEDDDEEDLSGESEGGDAAPAALSSKRKKPEPEEEAARRRRRGPKEPVQSDGANAAMPHRIDCPGDIDQFEELVDKYVVNPKLDLAALVDRILIWNNIHLPGHMGVENKAHMHNFIEILCKFVIKMSSDLTQENGFYTMNEVNKMFDV
jgi:nucleolar protein 14